MKSLYFNPNHENVLNTFCSDAIGRNEDVIRFCNILDAIDDCCTISLDGQWGSGKTFFVKQVKLLLDYLNSITQIDENDDLKLDSFFKSKPTLQNMLTSSETYATVYYDAWENDNDIDPILSLMYAILKANGGALQGAKTRSALKIAGTIAEIATGRNVSNFFESIKGENITNEIEKNKSVHDLMKKFINESISEHGNRLAIFIDELDRCKPTYAVQMLERIKHFFADDRVTFIFSINSQQLQYTIKNYYGYGFNASRYLDKFFDLRIALPEADYKKYMQLLNFEESQYVYDRMGYLVIKYFNFSMREIAKYIRLLKIAAYKDTHSGYSYGFPEENAIGFSLIYIVPILLGLKIHDMKSYNDFIQGRNNKAMVEILTLPDSGLNKKHWLLSNNETFKNDNEDEKKTKVELEQRLIDVYNAIFVNSYSQGRYECNIGEMSFGKNVRATILKVVSLLSSYAVYDF